jgi:hypothetical protein
MPLVVVTHPIALNDDAAIVEKADGAIEEIVSTLTDNAGAASEKLGG